MTRFAICLAVIALAGCATQLQPKLSSTPTADFSLVDLDKVNQTEYQRDYARCVQLANQDSVDLEASAGAVLNTAADKLTLGLVGGKQAKHADRVTVLKRCLTGRGYSVLR